MKRRRSSAPGRLRPDGRWPYPLLLLVLGMLVIGCGQATSSDRPTASGQPGASEPGSSPETPTAPSGGPSPAPSTEPTAATPSSSSVEPSTGTSNTGSAAACTGSDENRDFYASMAAAVDWTVYCPVLPDGWFVDDGQYRLAGGGWMQISYDGPGDTRILLRQGAFCAESDGCVPAGRDVAETAFGDQTGVLVAGDDGSWSTVVDRGATRSWLLVATGLDEASARAIAADLLAVSG